MNQQEQIKLTDYDKKWMEIIGRQAQAIQRITRYIDAFYDYDRRLAELNAAKRRFEEVRDAMDDYDREVYRKLSARVQSEEIKCPACASDGKGIDKP